MVLSPDILPALSIPDEQEAVQKCCNYTQIAKDKLFLARCDDEFLLHHTRHWGHLLILRWGTLCQFVYFRLIPYSEGLTAKHLASTGQSGLHWCVGNPLLNDGGNT